MKIADILEKIRTPQIPAEEIKISSESGKDIRPVVMLAIEQLSSRGGGRICIPQGVFRCDGPIRMKSHIELHLSEGSFIKFAPEPELYLPPVETRWEGVEIINFSPMIYGVDVTDCAITGRGILAGGSEIWRSWMEQQSPAQDRTRRLELDHVPMEKRIFNMEDKLRPAMIQFFRSSQILFEDFTMTDASFWMLHPVYCTDITIRRVSFDSMFINNDGIDVDSCEKVLIEDCFFRNGDDAIVIKAGRDADGLRVNRPTRNVLIRNCIFEDVLHGFAIGSELSGGAENIYLRNITMKNVRCEAFCLKSTKGRGGVIQNIDADGLVIEKAGRNLISIHSNYSSTAYGEDFTLFKDIYLRNITCKRAKNVFIFQGREELPLGTILIENLTVDQAETLYELDEHSGNVRFTDVRVNGEKLLHP